MVGNADKPVALSRGDAERVASIRRALTRVWPEPGFLESVIGHVTSAFDRDEVLVGYLREKDGSLGTVRHTLHPPFDSWASFGETKHIAPLLRYSVAAPDRWANSPVDERTLYRGRAEALEEYRTRILRKVDLEWQLRVTLYDESRFVGYFGRMRSRTVGPFRSREHALVCALVPALRDAFDVASTFDHGRVAESGVIGIMEALDRAAFLVTRSGAIVHANALARAMHAAPPTGLAEIVRRPDRDYPGLWLHALHVEGVPLWLVQYRRPAVPAPARLPPSLERVRALMAQGFSDKEIATALDLPYSTARTYATRVLQRLGAHDRRELIRGGRDA